MNRLHNLLPIGFVLSVFLTACTHERDPVEQATRHGRTPESPVTARAPDTPMLPNMPAPAEPPTAPESRDSAATKPLNELSKGKESKTMPEALHGNNHSSPALDQQNKGDAGALKKSSAIQPKARKIIWI